MSGYLYIAHKRVASVIGLNIYKIGQTEKTVDERMQSYELPKPNVLYSIPVRDARSYETKVLRIFRQRFKACKEYGKESFEGDIEQMKTVMREFVVLENAARDSTINISNLRDTPILMTTIATLESYDNLNNGFVKLDIQDSQDTDLVVTREEVDVEIINIFKSPYTKSTGTSQKQLDAKTQSTDDEQLLKYKCHQCSKHFATMVGLNKHLNPEVRKYPCNLLCGKCGKKCNNTTSYLNHPCDKIKYKKTQTKN
jgi:hypothetical protein